LINGDVLVLSAFHPKVQWSVQLAMARNPIICGLANQIYVAESGDKGGTWSGVVGGLRKGRTIYVRIPSENEKNANELLLQKVAVPVNDQGEQINDYHLPESTVANVNGLPVSQTVLHTMIVELLSSGIFSSTEILEQLKIDWSFRKLIIYLKTMEDVVILKKKTPLRFTLKGEVYHQNTLF
jgi:predicted Rossmann fold nucleotide-binding protein DprA/Smf involved in DNA uptake